MPGPYTAMEVILAYKAYTHLCALVILHVFPGPKFKISKIIYESTPRFGFLQKISRNQNPEEWRTHICEEWPNLGDFEQGF